MVQYFGGKDAALKRGLREQLLTRSAGCRRFFDLFMGSGRVSAAMAELGCERIGVDVFSPVVCLHRAMQADWNPPTVLRQDTWRALKRQARQLGLMGDTPWAPCEDPLIPFAGFGMSLFGRFFCSYLHPGHGAGISCAKGQTDPCGAARTSILKVAEGLRGVLVERAPYWKPRDFGPGDVVYCDIPYANTDGYVGTGSFDHVAFWRWARRVARTGALVLVSEFNAPPWVNKVWVLSHRAKSSGDMMDDCLFEVPA